jgi:FtsZ-interacting cell division protein ZipA
MSTGLIILIVVAVLILLALLVMLPRMRKKADERKAKKELESRRERVATEHRDTASARQSEAERAEQEAEIAQQKARAQRAEAERHESEAKMHERGLADDKLVEDDERDRFRGISGDSDRTDDTADEPRRSGHERAEHEPVGEGRTEPTEQPAARQASAADDESRRPDTEYEQGREDERAEQQRR